MLIKSALALDAKKSIRDLTGGSRSSLIASTLTIENFLDS